MPPDGSETRAAIVAAAMRGFAERGFDATSVREIATEAGCNLAAVSYHFGGKEALREACAEWIVARMGEVLAGLGDAPPASPAAATEALTGFARAVTRFLLLAPDGRLVAGFLMRELSQPSAALDAVYDGFLAPAHRRLCGLWQRATGRDPESAEVRLAVFAAIGQILYFHLARPVVERRMEWQDIGEAETLAVAEAISANLRARIAADRIPADRIPEEPGR